jgi:hypothetical protein
MAKKPNPFQAPAAPAKPGKPPKGKAVKKPGAKRGK